MTPSTRAKILTRRTYNRPKNEEGTEFETWEETVGRVIDHQRWLWERSKDSELNTDELLELEEFRELLENRKAFVSGRTLWLGGTNIAQTREASQFNCSFTEAETVRDAVDALWLLMQGCGVGFSPITGTLNGFSTPIKDILVIPTERTGKGGKPHNKETYENGVWTIQVGDSAESWSRALGKILAGKYPKAEKLVFDFSQIRPAGERLKGYGWISSGDEAISKAFVAIAGIMNKRAGHLLTAMDILDIYNWMGTILSSRRSAEIALLPYGHPEWREFAVAKRDCWEENPQRAQSNNSLVFYNKPTREELAEVFQLMEESGGSEPGFINGQAALKRAPWFKGLNPCAEILLGNKSFCNLTEVDLGKFKGDSAGLERAIHLVARANYRQTCVNLQDGVLQEEWHLNNEFLRLCGVGLTGFVKRSDLSPYDLSSLERIAVSSAYGMADELGLQRPKNVTTVKPSGTLSKIADTTEGVHKPLGKYIFNNVNFSKYDPLLEELRRCGYRTMPNPMDADAVIVTIPVKYDGVDFDVVDGKEVNLESAISQLERYKVIQNSWTQQNTSVTISYSPSEAKDIVDWLITNWDSYVGVSFIYRNDPTKTAEDLGYKYLPQEVVNKEEWEAYSKTLQEVELDKFNTMEELREEECAGGACPIK